MSPFLFFVKNTPNCKEVAQAKGGTRIKSTVCVYHDSSTGINSQACEWGKGGKGQGLTERNGVLKNPLGKAAEL